MENAKKKYFSSEDVAELRETNILDYLEERGYELEKKADSFKLLGEGGLYINSDGTKWNCFSGREGGGVIQLLMRLEKCTWYECLVKLDEFKNGIINDTPKIPRTTRNIEAVEKHLILPDKNKDYKRLYAYLIQTRGIDSDIVNKFVHDKKLYQNTKGSCVFIGYNNENTPKYASWRATVGGMRGDCPGSDKVYGFLKEGTNNILKIVEAPIELLSILNMDKVCSNSEITPSYKNEFDYTNNHYLSLGGLFSGAMDNYLLSHPEIDTIEFCLNDDKEAKENWGQKAANHFKEIYGDLYNCKIRLPMGNDFNDELKTLKTFLNAPSFPGKSLDEVKEICKRIRADPPPQEIIENKILELNSEKAIEVEVVNQDSMEMEV